MLHAEAAEQRRETDEPEREVVAAVEVEVDEAGEVVEELVGELLGLVDNEDGDLAEVVDEVDDGALEVSDELTAAMRGA